MPGERGRIGPQGAPVSRIFLLSPYNSSLILLKFKSLSLKVFIRVTASHFCGEFCCSLRKLGLSRVLWGETFTINFKCQNQF